MSNESAKLRKELENTKRELNDLKQEYREFTYIVSHDFRAPFRQIEGFSQFILKDATSEFDEKTKKRFESIKTASIDGHRMLDSLLEFSNANVNRNSFTTINSNELIRKVKEDLHDEIKSSQAEIFANSLPNILGDEEQIYEVFHQLIDNSIKFQNTHNKPVISISTIENNGKHKFSIKDNGIGIRDNFKDKIFFPLRKAGTGDDYSGNGIGLAIVKKIINQHGGDIWLHDSNNTGSEFAFTLKTIKS